MDFRVDLTDQAKRDIAAIHAWLQSQHAGDTGERWFAALRAAIPLVLSKSREPSFSPMCGQRALRGKEGRYAD